MVVVDPAGPCQSAGTHPNVTWFATERAQGLAVTSNGGAWFQGVFEQPLDLTGRSVLSYGLQTGAAGTSAAISFPNGPNHDWCQSNFEWQPENGTYHIEIDLTTALS